MTDARSTSPESPPWEILLAHHTPERYSRTLRLRVWGRSLHFCARCSGQVAGALAFVVVAVVTGHLSFALYDLRVQSAIGLFPIPAAIDWLTQSTGRRESGNRLRAVSGALLGFASVDLLAALLLARWWVFLGGLAILAVYLVAVLTLLRATGAWRRVLAEHFPDVEPGPES